MNLLEFIESFRGQNNPFGDLAENTPYEELREKSQREIIFHYETQTSVTSGSRQAWRSLLYLYRMKKRKKTF